MASNWTRCKYYCSSTSSTMASGCTRCKYYCSSTSSTMASGCTILNDPVHKTIVLHPLCITIIDTLEFQRLRYIKQCGISHHVYPSAVHSRFEHSIGVYHLAGKMLEQLRKSTHISDEDSLCVKIAALLHDLGHGPFSHLWERFINNVNNYTEPWHHEEMSLKLFRYVKKKYNLTEEFAKYNLKDKHIELIENIISGDVKDIDSKKLFLLEIVANKKTNIDVDRWDYLLRDAYFFGVICPVNLDRIISYTVVTDSLENWNKPETRIAFRDKICENILETFQYRMKLHKICYQHRVCKNIEIMLIDALKAADNCFFEDGLKLSNCHENLEAYSQLDDGLMNLILYSKDEKLEKSRNILKRIIHRNLYSEIGIITLKTNIPMKDLQAFQTSFNESHNLDLRLVQIDINMGIGKSNNPFENVIFYSKNRTLSPPKEEARSERETKLLIFSVNKTDIKPEILINEIKEICTYSLKVI